MGVAARIGFAGFMLLVCAATPAAELRLCVRADPKTFDPLLGAEEASVTIRFLTGGVLIRLNRQTQRLEPELAASWKVARDGRRIDFELRRGVRFSDGTPFSSADVVATLGRIMDPSLHSSTADSFRSAGGTVKAEANGPARVTVSFSTPVAGLELLFDQLAISSARSVRPESAVLGPFVLQVHKGGQYVLLKRNPHYWKIDRGGTRLPYLDAIRLDIQANRETELLRFRRGELHLMDRLDPEAFARLQKEKRPGAIDAGPSLDSEFFWFNQNPNAPLPSDKKRWFRSRPFRQAVSAAINRDDIIRLVYHGYAHSAAGPTSPANKFWFHSGFAAVKHDRKLALKLLQSDGFHLDGSTLRDRSGTRVEFSLITNAGSNTRTRIGAMLQQDLSQVGIRVNFTPIEFQSLIERIMGSQSYEACLLGITNVGIDPNDQMNVWMSSGTLHPWYPAEPKPVTAWEAEIDRLMQMQHRTMEPRERKKAFDRVQEIVAEEAPIVYLVHPNVLAAIAPSLLNAAPSPLPPHLLWNVEYLSIGGAGNGRNR